MKIVRFAIDDKPGYGILKGEQIQALAGSPYRFIKPLERYYRLNQVRLLAPATPSKIVACGLNYCSHVAETNHQIPTSPVLFIKPSTAVIGPGDSIIYFRHLTRVDYEGELGVVIKRRTWQVPASEALSCVLGYTCFNDVTARDLQHSDGQWTRAKGFNTFGALGPCIETELDPGKVMVETYLNGERKQQGNTRDLIFPVPELLSFISQVMTLLPGDIIATGTPDGIGPMQVGDHIEIKIPLIGTLQNTVTAG
jgi:2-keto-4-pentenoate hydratase/2-oxohepta-3-ene-1,7-dioic acid hydratase in catechol pathway